MIHMAILKITDLTNITPRHHIQHQIENERMQQGQIRHHGPGDTTLSHPSAPPFSPAPSIPTRSVRIYEPGKQRPIARKKPFTFVKFALIHMKPLSGTTLIAEMVII